jgi:hypothetical protein
MGGKPRLKSTQPQQSGNYAKTNREINTALLGIEDGCPIHFKSILGVV